MSMKITVSTATGKIGKSTDRSTLLAERFRDLIEIFRFNSRWRSSNPNEHAASTEGLWKIREKSRSLIAFRERALHFKLYALYQSRSFPSNCEAAIKTFPIEFPFRVAGSLCINLPLFVLSTMCARCYRNNNATQSWFSHYFNALLHDDWAETSPNCLWSEEKLVLDGIAFDCNLRWKGEHWC